ncbi:class IIb bacteriocin, lactobin A/cerein 7B family [Rudanella paleaurantiibacter]|uniref:Class IIb bacteriocin, lactobin A/cerein 7B family n=1 Tax=Rudanella paleaurantiibacter TaxID=2614655 RepID=A0A7J5TS28_9BACT|nr:class IIb bacteriocin, lactobin A/cerein 7B family [Rudanella paleaurantiibacter]KAB7725718.1 class IIb bacteriocin, lactobin A/cerein 7B family [Rudanella paleaurantiibacter]
MMTQEQQKQAETLVRTLAQKAWESSTFKEQLIRNPVSTIESVTGQAITPNTKIVVEDQTDNSVIYLNIPRKVEFDELELTDEQLETVSGGSTPLCVGYAAYAVILIGVLAAGVTVGESLGNAVK